TDRLLYNLARLYAQAVSLLDAQARAAPFEKARPLWQRLALCQDKALDSLRQTLGKLPEKRRGPFWRTQIHADPAFASIRRPILYRRLAAGYDANEFLLPAAERQRHTRANQTQEMR